MLRTLLVVAILATPALAQPAGKEKPAEAPKADPAAKAAKRVGDPYPFDTCPMAGEDLAVNGKPVVKVIETFGGAREVRFCCDMCAMKFMSDQAANWAKIDERIVKDQSPLYPVTTSVVSGKKLPEKAVDTVVGNRLVRLAEEGEKAELAKDPAKYIEVLNKAAIEKQTKAYTMKVCVVTDEELGSMGDTKDIVVAGRLIRLCCNGCKKDVDKTPAKFVAKVDAARKAPDAKK